MVPPVGSLSVLSVHLVVWLFVVCWLSSCSLHHPVCSLYLLVCRSVHPPSCVSVLSVFPGCLSILPVGSGPFLPDPEIFHRIWILTWIRVTSSSQGSRYLSSLVGTGTGAEKNREALVGLVNEVGTACTLVPVPTVLTYQTVLKTKWTLNNFKILN